MNAPICIGISHPVDLTTVIPAPPLSTGVASRFGSQKNSPQYANCSTDASVQANLAAVAPDLAEVEQRKVLGSFNFSGDTVLQRAGTLSGGEKTRLALARLVVSSANVLLLDEPTNNLDPASREQVLGALRSYRGAIVLVTHDEGAVQALHPERVLLLPDGVEDHWSADLADLVALA